jgi:hypothetical protein
MKEGFFTFLARSSRAELWDQAEPRKSGASFSGSVVELPARLGTLWGLWRQDSSSIAVLWPRTEE